MGADRRVAGLLLCAALSGACAGSGHALGAAAQAGPPELGASPGYLVIAGEHVPIAAEVIHWFDPGGYSAYDTDPGHGDDPPVGLRYAPGRAVEDGRLPEPLAERIRSGRATRAELAERIDQFVIHYDVSGTSQACFEVLQELRGLSVHFLCDLDGTLYQTLDLADQAWHAAKANRRSVGVEVAQIGAYPPGSDAARERLGEWYQDDPGGGGTRLVLPERYGLGGLRHPERARATATPGPTEGVINGQLLVQYDFTAAQYTSLAALAGGLHQALPRIALDVPRDEQGDVLRRMLTDEEYAAWQGLLGHLHVTDRKVDPGPALRWDDLLEAAQKLAM